MVDLQNIIGDQIDLIVKHQTYFHIFIFEIEIVLFSHLDPGCSLAVLVNIAGMPDRIPRNIVQKVQVGLTQLLRFNLH